VTDGSRSKRGQRADAFLVEKGFAASRAEAQAAIAAGHVRADGKPVSKSAQVLSDAAEIDYAPSHPYVSRGALKLVAALDHFAISPSGLVCLDLGASTGGFTEVLLKRGAAKIYAIDVGHNQLNPKIARDPRVVSREGVNARALDAEQIPEPPQLIVADVSFISLKLALPAALRLAAPGAGLIALIKPQFEVGRERLGKGGIVKNEADRMAARDEIVAWLSHEMGWTVEGTMESPIEGGDGNKEYLLRAKKL
jgi:23S rRNA (cytidine1920-2'-O)/16S rRNA (cytidine1409-2'-O)-methyltransferase